MEIEKLLTRREVAEIAKVSSRTVLNWEAKGLINGTRIGRTVRYDISEVKQLLGTSKKP